MERLTPDPDRWSQVLPEIVVPPATMIASSTRFTNIYTPAPETILLDEERLPPQPSTVVLRRGQTRSLLEQRAAGRKAALRHVVERLRQGPVLDLGERIVYDARWIYSDNLAHLMGSHLGNLSLIKHVAGIGSKDCVVVLEKNSSRMTHNLFHLIGYETVETNRPVAGNVVEVEFNHDVAYHLIPNVPLLAPPDLKPGKAEKIFISRRSSRRIRNEAEVIAIVRERGYETCYFEDIPMAEQWALVRDARSIVAVHGAALGYLNTKPGTPGRDYTLLEIFSPGLVVDCHRKATAVIGGQWVGCRGRITSDFTKAVDESQDFKSLASIDFHVDPKALERAFVELDKLTN